MKIPPIFRSRSFILLFLITFFGLTVRLVALSDFPNGFARDEAYLGYNAYSLLQTGRDINGNLLPLFIESFLYTPSGYAYLSIPFIKLFGLSIFSVRIVSALFGVATIPLIYFLTKSLFISDLKRSFSDKYISYIGILSAFFLMISPWHINLSRTASVSTVVTFFILLGVTLLFRWLRVQKITLLIMAFSCFFATLLLYIAPYSFIPFLLFLFVLLYAKKIKKLKYLIILFLTLLLPIITTYIHKDFSIRVQSLSLTRHPIVPITLTENANRDGVEMINPLISRVFHNKVTVIGDLYIDNYFKHLSYGFLFSDEGFPDRYRVPEVGLIFPTLIVLIMFGVYTMLTKEGKAKWFLIGWILISPIGSAFANDDVPNLQRILFMLPPLLIFAGVGFLALAMNSKLFINKLITICVVLFFCYQSIFYFHQYLVHGNAYRPWYRQEGYEELALKLLNLEDSYNRIVVTNRESAPTLILSFFNRFDPSLLQHAIKKSQIKDTDRVSFGKYFITEEECPVKLQLNEKSGKEELTGERGILYVNSGLCKIDELPKEVKRVDTIKRTDGSIVFYLLTLE